MDYKILNTEPEHYSPWAKQELSKIGELRERVVSQKELMEIIPEIDILLIGWGLQINKAVLLRAQKLKVIVSATTNEFHLDLTEAASRKIKVFTLKGEREILDKVPSTAELAFGLLLSLARFIPCSFEAVKNYSWQRDKFKGNELFEKTFGILGYGRLGRIAARIARGFEMKVISYDPNVSKEIMKEQGVEAVSFDELIRQSDVLSLHLPATEQNKGLVNREVFEKMKKSAYLINTARGELINEADLLWALENNTIAGAGLDFLQGEWGFAEKVSKNSLIEYAKTHRNLIITPHLGGMSDEAVFKVRDFLTKKVIDYLQRRA